MAPKNRIQRNDRNWKDELKNNDEIMKRVKENDNLFRSKRVDRMRANLYIGLTRFLKSKPIENAKVFMMHKPAFEKLCESELPFLNKRMNRQKKVQELTEYVMTEYELEGITSFCTMLDLQDTITRLKEIEWKAYRLKMDNGGKNALFGTLDVKSLKAHVETKFGSMLRKLQRSQNKLYFDHYKCSENFIFIGVRIQDNKKHFNVTFAFKPEHSHFFMHAEIQDVELMKAVATALGFDNFLSQKLRAKNLISVFEATVQKKKVVDSEALNRQFDRGESELNARGLPRTHKQLMLSCAELAQGQSNGISSCVFKYKVPILPEEESNTSSASSDKEGEAADAEEMYGEIIMKVKVKTGTLDGHFANLYSRGLIKDVSAYMKMKKYQTNSISLKRKIR